MWGSADVVGTLLVFEYMRFALQRETKTLNAGRYQSDYYSELYNEKNSELALRHGRDHRFAVEGAH